MARRPGARLLDGDGQLSRSLTAGVPTGPFLDPQTGDISSAWRSYLVTLGTRTGGSEGSSSDTTGLQTQIDAEKAARIAEDTALSTGIATEAANRSAGDATLQTALNNETNTRIFEDNLEATNRANQDALLLPKAGGTISGPLSLTGIPTSA